MSNICCNIVGDTGLQDDNENCPGLASLGACAKYPDYMLVFCMKSCSGNVWFIGGIYPLARTIS